jgi:DNA-binding transcriptional LysR family regulator
MQWTDRLGYRLKLRDLHILMAVVESGSMNKAAQRMAVSPPVVSKAIADIEHIFGVRLFDRTPQGVEPTIYGNALLDSGRAAFDDLKQGVRQIEFLAKPETGEVRLGCNEPFAAGLLPAIIEKIGRKYPGIVCHVVPTPLASTQEYRDLRERRVDLIVARFDQSLEQDLQAELLYYEQPVVVAGRRSKWARRQRVALQDLINEPWLVTPPDALPTAFIEGAFRACGVAPPKGAVVSLSVHLRNTLLATGRYLGVIPGSLVRYGVMRGVVKILPVKFPAEAGPVGIITLKNRTLSPTVKLFIEIARELAEPLLKFNGAAPPKRRKRNGPGRTAQLRS